MAPRPDTLRFVSLWQMDGTRSQEDEDAGWRNLTDAGNAAFANKDYATALRRYEAAVGEAELLFHVAQDGGSPFFGPITYTISCQNMAKLKQLSGEGTAAYEFLIRAVKKLIETAEHSSTPVALRANCLRHLPHALGFLAESFPDEKGRSDRESFVARGLVAEAEIARVYQGVSAHQQLGDRMSKPYLRPH